MAAAEAEGIPFDVLMPNNYPLPVRGIPPMGMGLRPSHSLIGSVASSQRAPASTQVDCRRTNLCACCDPHLIALSWSTPTSSSRMAVTALS